MRDYTCNNYCDFLWINDLLELKKSPKCGFSLETLKNGKAASISIVNVIVFGTIVEVKQVGIQGYLYHVDDGTGVIACKHTLLQFEEMLSVIEGEQYEVLNCTLQSGKSKIYDISADDTIFNDNSIQSDEKDVIERNKLIVLQSIWEDIYQSFNGLIEEFQIGDTVVIQGKLYNYFNRNQIYINNIRRMSLAEELMKVGVKLEQRCDKLNENAVLESEINRKRFSGLMTFDSIQHLNPKFPNPRSINVSELKEIQEESRVLTPNLKSTITFDTFSGKTN